MVYSWLPKLFIPVVIGLIFSIFRKYFPAKPNLDPQRYDRPNDELN
jgi:hypothetical protein